LAILAIKKRGKVLAGCKDQPKTKFSSTNIFKGKKNMQQSESEKHSTIKLLIGVHGGFLTRMMNVTK
jgi:hypothetical protein